MSKKSMSSGIKTEGVGRGQTVNSAYGLDNVKGLNLPDTRGGSLRGSTENISHSLQGARAVDAGGLGTAGKN